ncbi:hypothetical protein [Candidatus Odyssella acanthamoebae]|uniref:Uncharacterized protein n=1 Tax=Candidatus Odyssella acanthamoebae TaxID=91604 RepID=A0A077B1X5_9PROT|nr:hypothetical protein [Candidatus Paracaedibacter acanthamoebae]AIK96920.1 hypothetical protein ID47_09555 [Candidatus Paracaedibacter acanthamoebae]
MPILVDIIMIGLLVGVIIHSARLSKSLANFKVLHSEMLPMMKDYARTLIETRTQMQELKNISSEVDHIITSRIPPALMIKNDLDFLVSRANELADHLEALVAKGRQQEFPIIKETLEKETRETTEKAQQPKVKKKLKPLAPFKLKATVADKVAPLPESIEPDILEEVSISPKKPALESFFSSKAVKKVTSKARTHAA